MHDVRCTGGRQASTVTVAHDCCEADEQSQEASIRLQEQFGRHHFTSRGLLARPTAHRSIGFTCAIYRFCQLCGRRRVPCRGSIDHHCRSYPHKCSNCLHRREHSRPQTIPRRSADAREKTSGCTQRQLRRPPKASACTLERAARLAERSAGPAWKWEWLAA